MKVRVIRFVSEDEEHNFLHHDIYPGEEFYLFTASTYGCISPGGIALSDRGEDEYPFFEFPHDAVEEIDDLAGTAQQ